MTRSQKGFKVIHSIPKVPVKGGTPLIVFLTGSAGSIEPYVDNVVPMAQQLGWYSCCPENLNKGGFRWWGEAGFECIEAAINEMLWQYPIDSTRKVLMGFSEGGRAVWDIGLNFPGLFKALVPMAGATDVQQLYWQKPGVQGQMAELFGSVPACPHPTFAYQKQSARYRITNPATVKVLVCVCHGSGDQQIINTGANDYRHSDAICGVQTWTDACSQGKPMKNLFTEGWDFIYLKTDVGHQVDPQWFPALREFLEAKV